MNVADVMTSPPVTVASDSTLSDVVEAMLEHHIGSVIVVDAAPIGIITRTDVLRALSTNRIPLRSIAAADAMSQPLVTIPPRASLESALRQMEEHQVKKLPVIDDLSLVGVVTMTDIARQLPQKIQEVREAMEQRDEWTD